MTAEEFKALQPMQQIRMLSGMFPKDENVMIARLTLICLITRVQLGDAEQSFLDEVIDKSFGVKKQKQEESKGEV